MKSGFLRTINTAFICGLTIWLSACLAPPRAAPPSTLHPIEVALTPNLMPLREALHTCAVARPEIALILTETSAAFLDVQMVDLALWFGPPLEEAEFAAPIAQERIDVIVNPENQVSAISTRSLSAVFSGQINNWEDIGGENQEIEVWMLPEKDEFTRIFQQSVLENRPFTSLARLAPDPAAMLKAISENPASIGYLPGAWLSKDVKSVRLEQQVRSTLRHPILALASAEPQSFGRNLLHCLQSGEGQNVLLKRYGARQLRSQTTSLP